MEPLSALDVASGAIQIFDFISRLWFKIEEVCESESGRSSARQNIVTDARRVCDLNSQLSKSSLLSTCSETLRRQRRKWWLYAEIAIGLRNSWLRPWRASRSQEIYR